MSPSSIDLPEEGDLPSTISRSTDPQSQASTFLHQFETAWNKDDMDRLMDLFASSSTTTPFWRDMVAFTWNICTLEGRDVIRQALMATSRPMTTFALSPHPLPLHVTSAESSSSNSLDLEFWADLTMDGVGSGKAHFRLIPVGKDYKISTLLTTLLGLQDRPFRINHHRSRGHVHGPIRHRRYWHEPPSQPDPEEPLHVAIIGGGQAGLALGARLQLMDVPYRIFEAGDQPGMAWKNRYPSLHLHDPVWYNHMPYLPFPESWPILCPRNKIADWMQSYATIMDLEVQTNTRVLSAKQDDEGETPTWILQTATQTAQPIGPQPTKTTTVDHTIRARHVVFATGNSSHPKIPSFPGRDLFPGRQWHSSRYQGGRDFRNRRVVVIGSNNSAFDICQDLWEQGAQDVTMIQRSPSLVVSTEAVLKHGLGPLYREDAPMHHEDADLVGTCTPYKVLLETKWKAVTDQMKRTDREMHENLVASGYQLEFGPDATGVFAKSASEGGGFYINMGCVELLTEGKVTVRYADVVRLEKDGVVVQDKEKETMEEELITADDVIYATGFATMDQWVAQICGKEVADRVGRTWGIGLGKSHKDPGPWEGELRNMWKPTTVDGLWFHGGNLAQSRHYSRFLALQLAAGYIGIETPVYGMPKPTPPLFLA